MKPERWERLKALFDSAREHEPNLRPEFLRNACAGDETLRAEVQRMLERDAEAPDFLESPAWVAAGLSEIPASTSTRILGAVPKATDTKFGPQTGLNNPLSAGRYWAAAEASSLGD